MTNKLQTAFDSIRAEQALKDRTMVFLRQHMQHKGHVRIPVRRIAAALVCLVLLTAGAFGLYFTETAYVDLDVNPSIAFAVNRFDRVINTYAYNDDGAEVLAGIQVMHKDYRVAVETAVESMEQKGYLTGDALISVTLQTGDEQKDAPMLASLESAVRHHCGAAQIDAFSVDSDTRTAAQDLNLTPAKYLAYLALREVDPSATAEGCRRHSVQEIYEMTEEHHSSGASTDAGEQNGMGRHGHHHGGRH